MLPSTNLLSLAILFISTFIVPAHTKGCRAIRLRWIHSFQLTPPMICGSHCDTAAMTREFAKVLNTKDECQRAGGFSTFVPFVFTVVGNCICGVQTEAQRVSKTTLRGSINSCDVFSYTERVTRRPAQKYNPNYYSEWEVTRPDVKCK